MMNKTVFLSLLKMAMLNKIFQIQPNQQASKMSAQMFKVLQKYKRLKTGLTKGSDGQCNNGQYR